MNKRDRLYARIFDHGVNLLQLFPKATERNPIRLCKALRRCETAMHRIQEDDCNGNPKANTEALDTAWRENMEAREERIKARVSKLLGVPFEYPLMVNGDPRGYSLKIDDDYMHEHNVKLHRDWGGYGIIAPDLSAES